MVERGEITGFHGYAYVAGFIPNKFAQEMAKFAETAIRNQNEYLKLAPNEVKINVVSKREHETEAVGTGSGFL